VEYEKIVWLITVQNHNGGPCKIFVIVDRASVVRHIVKCGCRIQFHTTLYHVIPHTASQYHTLLHYTGLVNINHPTWNLLGVAFLRALVGNAMYSYNHSTWNLLGIAFLRALVGNSMYVDFRPTSGFSVKTNIDDPTWSMLG
jgi:hypothetical protein